MKFTVLIESKAQNSQSEICANPDYRSAHKPYDDALYLVVEGQCKACGDTPAEEFRVRGDATSLIKKNEYLSYCVVYCERCCSPVGTLKIESSSLFGHDEDQLVLNGRPRVY